MKRILIALVVVTLGGLPTVADADYHDPGEPEHENGFSDRSCIPEPDDVLPGDSGIVHTVDDSGGADHLTIQNAVDAASPGDTVLVHPGVYAEQVDVTTDALRIRGTDRGSVIIDGQNSRQYGIYVYGADRVLIENMTGHNTRHTAFYWRHAHGYWGRNLTGYNNRLYGVYAFGARCGQFNDSFGSGNADSAFYIGECFTCDAVIHDVVAEENGLGYSGTNAGGNLTIRNSVWRDNALGIVPNSLDSELEPPQRGATIIDNDVVHNNGQFVPGAGAGAPYWGLGIIIAGGKDNVVANNRVLDHVHAGIGLAPLPSENVWTPSSNVIWNNTVGHPADDPAYDETLDLAQGASSGPENCWEHNHAPDGYEITTAPPALSPVWDCSQNLTPPGGDPRAEQKLIEGELGLNGRVVAPWETWPAPNTSDDPEAFVDLADPDCDAGTDCGIDRWLPALGLS